MDAYNMCMCSNDPSRTDAIHTHIHTTMYALQYSFKAEARGSKNNLASNAINILPKVNTHARQTVVTIMNSYNTYVQVVMSTPTSL